MEKKENDFYKKKSSLEYVFKKSELNGLRENVQDLYSRCLGSRENTENKVGTVLVDTLYVTGVHICPTFYQSKLKKQAGAELCHAQVKAC